MPFLPTRSNDALDINRPTETIYLTTGGSDWLWAVTAVYCFSLLAVVALSYFAKAGEKIFHYLFTISLFVGSVSWFAAASGLGATPIATSINERGTRQIFYVKYINWFVGWTPLITAVGLFSGVSWSTIIYNIFLNWIWIASYLASALTPTSYKWGFFAFGTFAYFLLSASLLHTGLVTSKRLGVHTHYLAIAGYLVFIWFLYPIAFGVDDGGNKIGVTQGFIFFGILDVLIVPVLAFVFLGLSRKWDYRALNLYFTQYGRVPPPSGSEFPEREKAAPAETPATAPVAPEATVIAPQQAV